MPARGRSRHRPFSGSVLVLCGFFAWLLPGVPYAGETPAVPSAPAPGSEGEFFATAGGDTVWFVEEHVVWGHRVFAVTDYASRVDVIDRQRVTRTRRAPGANALSAIATLPGVAYHKVGLVANGASGDPPAVFRIRGVGSIPNDGLLVMVDGRPQYVGVWGHSLPDAHRLGPVQRIEVVRGPASVQYGSQAFAGVVNIITTGGALNGDPRTELQAAGGNHGSFNLIANHRQQVGPIVLGLSASRARTDGYRDGDEGSVDGFRGRLEWHPSPGWRLSALADGSDSFFNNPGPEGASAMEGSPYADPSFGSGDIRQRAVEVTADGRGESWTARLKLYHNYIHNDFYQAGNTRARDYGLRLFGERRGEALAVKAGFDFDRYGGNFAVNGNPGFVPVDKYDTNTAPYLLASRDLSAQVSIAGGLRANFSNRYTTEWIPQARLRAEIARQTMLTLSAAKGFKTPSVAEQYLPFFAGDRTQLEPERMWQYEIGLSRRGQGWSAELALFQAEGDNLIRRAAPGWPPLYDNSGSFRHQGVEATLRRELSTRCGGAISAA